MTVPVKCRAAVVVNEGPDFTVKIEHVAVPKPGLGEILIRLNASGICYSDLHYMLNDTPAPPMSAFGVVTAGHEGCGIVVEIGSGVTNFKIGDRAGVKPIWTACGTCNLCLGDAETHCADKKNTGLSVAGTFQEYMLADARHAILIPEGVPDHLAATLMCSGATAYRSVMSAHLAPASDVVVLGGGGGVGIQVVQVAKALGFRPIVVDIGGKKREASLSVGAAAFVDIESTDDAVGEALKLTNGGAHGVFVTAPAAYQSAQEYVGNRVGASIMCIGLPATGSDHYMVIEPGRLILGQLSVKGSLVGTRQDTYAVLRLAQQGLIKNSCEIISLEKLPAVVNAMKGRTLTLKQVIDFTITA